MVDSRERDYFSNLKEATRTLLRGGVIAYPTESVYGLGCDPLNMDAVSKVLALKQRSTDKGFILIAATWEQIEPYVEPIEPKALTQVLNTWPGPVTWVFPASDKVPTWVRGPYPSVAVRVTSHPIAAEICEHFGGPIISTSANIEGFPPARDQRTLKMIFDDQLDFIFSGKLGGRLRPSEIRDAASGDILRKG